MANKSSASAGLLRGNPHEVLLGHTTKGDAAKHFLGVMVVFIHAGFMPHYKNYLFDQHHFLVTSVDVAWG